MTTKFPGENKLEQFSIAAKILQIPPLNNLVTYLFHNGNSWLTVLFHNQRDLNLCIKAMEEIKNVNIKLIDISEKRENKHHKIKSNQVQNNKEKEEKLDKTIYQ